MGINTSRTILVDCAHNNLITPDAPDFSRFFALIKELGYTLVSSTEKQLVKEDLEDIRTLIIGTPNNSYFFTLDISILLDFIRSGGSLLIFHKYGGDYLQQTNINELTRHFGIYFENTLVYHPHSYLKIEMVPIISNFSAHPIVSSVRKLIMAGACTIRLSRDASYLCKTNKDAWLDIYDYNTFSWTPYKRGNQYVIAAYAIYGQGRVLAIASPEIVSDHLEYGLEVLDNKKFLINSFKWLMEPVNDVEVRDWMLQQLGVLTKLITDLSLSVSSLEERVSTIEKRIRFLEFKYYKQKGIHFPFKEEDTSRKEEKQ